MKLLEAHGLNSHYADSHIKAKPEFPQRYLGVGRSAIVI
jgi:hypothetical protein